MPQDLIAERLCSHCRFPLRSNGSGLRHYGTHTAHQESECLRLLQAEIARLTAERDTLQGFADLWYFVMDEAPMAFEKIVAEWSSSSWMDQAQKLRDAKRAGKHVT